jgi:hypothetical protein
MSGLVMRQREKSKDRRAKDNVIKKKPTGAWSVLKQKNKE